MPEEITGEETTQEETVSTGAEETAQTENDPIADVIVDGEEEPSEESPTGGEEEEEEEENAEEEAEPEQPDEKYAQLEAHIRDLNKALHIERQKAKQREQEKAEPLSDEQLRQLMREHIDDPDTLFNIVNYMAEQKAKSAGKEAIDANVLSAQKAQHDQIIATKWPDLMKDDTPLRQVADGVKQEFRIDNHPLGDLLAMGVVTLNALPKIEQDAYERGKQDGMKGKVEKTRKKGVKDTTLTPSGKSRKSNKFALDDHLVKTADQIGLTESQKKIYARLIAKNNMEEK